MIKSKRIFRLAQYVADNYRMFKGRRSGGGSPYINEVINHLKLTVAQELGEKTINQFLSQENRQAVDFWLEDEQTIMEVEFNILSSPPVLERMIFKALLAKDGGKDVRNLIVIADPGSALLLQAPTPVSIINWVERHHHIRILIWELIDKDTHLPTISSDPDVIACKCTASCSARPITS